MSHRCHTESSTSQIQPDDYAQLLGEVKERVRGAQLRVLRAVNAELVSLYFDIGGLITQRQQGATWGKGVVKQLAAGLRAEFPGLGGFSERNLWYARELFRVYSSQEKLQPLVAKIGWAHNILILDKCKDDLEREFYLKMTRRMGWTKTCWPPRSTPRVLSAHCRDRPTSRPFSCSFTLPAPLEAPAKVAVKNEYLLDFLQLGDAHSKRELEQPLSARIEDFLRDMKGKMAFVGS